MLSIHKKYILFLISLIWTAHSFAQIPKAAFLHTGKCVGTPIMFEDISSTPSGYFDRWHWYFGTGNPGDTANAQYELFTYKNPGNYLVTLIAWNNLGLSDTAVQNVIVYPSPTATMKITLACFPDPIAIEDVSTISVGTVPERTWDINTFPSNQKVLNYSFSAPGAYSIYLTAKSDQGCLNIENRTIIYPGPPILSFAPLSPVEICSGDSVALTISGADTYLWENGNNTNTVTVKTSGYYKATGTIAALCKSTDSVYVNVLPNPTANAGLDSTIIEGDTLELQGSGGQDYIWSPVTALSDPSIANPLASPKTSTTYTLTVTDSNGCADSDTVIITVLPLEPIDTADTTDTLVTIELLKIHNMLTPNGDGHNDVWDLSLVPNIETASVYVFNRWGKEVFMAKNYQHDWGGTYNGEPLTDGTYVYVIKFENGALAARGTLEIMRNSK